MLHKTIFTCAIAAMTLASCSKEEIVPTPVAPAKSKAELIQANHWKLKAWTGIMEGTTENQDLFAIVLDECDHDDQFRFKAQGVMEYDQMTDQCSPEEPKVVTTTWTFDNATNRLRFSAGGFEVNALVSQVSDTSLQLQFSKDLLGVNFDHVWTFKKY